MSDRLLYASVVYKRSSMQRQIVAVSHCVKSLKRNHGGHIFRVEATPVPGSQNGLKEYKIVGKAIAA